MSNMQLDVIAVVQHHRFVANRFGLNFWLLFFIIINQCCVLLSMRRVCLSLFVSVSVCVYVCVCVCV